MFCGDYSIQSPLILRRIQILFAAFSSGAAAPEVKMGGVPEGLHMTIAIGILAAIRA